MNGGACKPSVWRFALSAALAIGLAACASPPSSPPVSSFRTPSPPPSPSRQIQAPASETQAPALLADPPDVAPIAVLPVIPADSSAANPTVPPAPDQPALDRGLASWYGPRFHGRRSANGERYDMHALTAAHKTLPFGTLVLVKSVATGREVIVRITDRGRLPGRVIDLSRAAAKELGMLGLGLTEVILLDAFAEPESPTPATPERSAPLSLKAPQASKPALDQTGP